MIYNKACETGGRAENETNKTFIFSWLTPNLLWFLNENAWNFVWS